MHKINDQPFTKNGRIRAIEINSMLSPKWKIISKRKRGCRKSKHR